MSKARVTNGTPKRRAKQARKVEEQRAAEEVDSLLQKVPPKYTGWAIVRLTARMVQILSETFPNQKIAFKLVENEIQKSLVHLATLVINEHR